MNESLSGFEQNEEVLECGIPNYLLISSYSILYKKKKQLLNLKNALNIHYFVLGNHHSVQHNQPR